VRAGAILALMLFLGGLPAVAATQKAPAATAPPGWTTGSEPLQIDSKTLETFGNEGRVVFQGDVVARQGDVTLHADRVEVRIDRQTRQIQRVKAFGHVRIRKAEIVATGNEADYDAQQGVAVLVGDPKVWRDRDVVAGEKITLYLAEDRSVVEGAKAILYQQKPELAPAGKPPPKEARDGAR
jgi:lipopolysaccharide export system protein LptA